MKFIIKFLFIIIITAIALGGYLGYTEYNKFIQEKIVLSPDTAVFEIKKGSNITQISNALENKGIISNAIYFKLLARLQEKSSKIKAGEYQLLPNMTTTNLLDLFVSGKTLQHQLSIIEGRTFKDLMAIIRNHPTLIQTLSDDDYKNIMTVIGSDASNPEGWFYPDTYNFPSRTTDIDFLKRAHKKMQAYLAKAWEKREKNPYIRTPYDALILASIVEKETGIPSERPLIAGVFLNRLKIDMMLQTDPTVIYGMGDSYKGVIYKSSLKRDTPYNTYTRKGLTPTPIATPSLQAIDAVLHPAKTDKLFFVADGTGGHYFSKTNAEHDKAVVRYRKMLREQKKQASKPAN